jgi:hypothetical protein
VKTFKFPRFDDGAERRKASAKGPGKSLMSLSGHDSVEKRRKSLKPVSERQQRKLRPQILTFSLGARPVEH